MRETILAVTCTLALLAPAACKGRNGAATSTATETVAPAAAKPLPTTNTDEATTQTIDIADQTDNEDRSIAEGGALTQPDTRTGTAAKSAKTKPSAPRKATHPAGRTK